jgi:hypothetical protein
MLKFTFQEASINRLAAVLAERYEIEADEASRRAAFRTVELLDETYRNVVGSDADPSPRFTRRKHVGTVYGGDNSERDIVKLADAMEGRAEKTATGWVAHFGMRDDLDELSKAKVRTVFMKGRSQPHTITPNKADWFLRLVRDQVYQRIRRGSV